MLPCHCDGRPLSLRRAAPCHCEERSDAAIPTAAQPPEHPVAAREMTATSGSVQAASGFARFGGRPPLRPFASALLRLASEVARPPRFAKIAATARAGSMAGRIAVMNPHTLMWMSRPSSSIADPSGKLPAPPDLPLAPPAMRRSAAVGIRNPAFLVVTISTASRSGTSRTARARTSISAPPGRRPAPRRTQRE